jgi:hypothetical protein
MIRKGDSSYILSFICFYEFFFQLYTLKIINSNHQILYKVNKHFLTLLYNQMKITLKAFNQDIVHR